MCFQSCPAVPELKSLDFPVESTIYCPINYFSIMHYCNLPGPEAANQSQTITLPLCLTVSILRIGHCLTKKRPAVV